MPRRKYDVSSTPFVNSTSPWFDFYYYFKGNPFSTAFYLMHFIDKVDNGPATDG